MLGGHQQTLYNTKDKRQTWNKNFIVPSSAQNKVYALHSVPGKSFMASRSYRISPGIFPLKKQQLFSGKGGSTAYILGSHQKVITRPLLARYQQKSLFPISGPSPYNFGYMRSYRMSSIFYYLGLLSFSHLTNVY